MSETSPVPHKPTCELMQVVQTVPLLDRRGKEIGRQLVPGAKLWHELECTCGAGGAPDWRKEPTP